MALPPLLFSGHALQRMIPRGIGEPDVRSVLETGDAIEDYPDDTPYPSALYLGFVSGRPVHVVAATDAQTPQIIVVTVYIPDSALWDATFRRRVVP